MSKINLKYTVSTNDTTIKNKTIGIINNNELIYLEEEVKVIFNYKNKILKRENNLFIMEYDFVKEMGYYLIKEFNQRVDINFNIKKIDIDKNNIDIIYIVDKDRFEYRIEVVE